MDIAEVEESVFAASDAKLHGEMCRKLSAVVCKVLEIFPELEASRPRSKTGIQTLCLLHMALEKAKSLLHHCSDCSKLYLAITGDSVLLKFEKVKAALEDSLRRVEDIVPSAIGSQILEILEELEGIVFSLDQSEKEVGEEVILLLQREKSIDSHSNDNMELEMFHQAAMKLGITSSRTAVAERRALKRLVERARLEDDRRKESIVAYLLHLMRKYSKLFRSEVSDDNDSQRRSTPCSPTVNGSFDDCGGNGVGRAFERHLSKLSSFNFRPNGRLTDHAPTPPEEFRCPISLQLMYDPVIISSGQTYERVCIEKWFSDGHNTCPKTQQQLSHLCLTPNYCVKGLIASWCEHNGIPPVPDRPPGSLDINCWGLPLQESEMEDARSTAATETDKIKARTVISLEDCGIAERLEECEITNSGGNFDRYDSDRNLYDRYDRMLAALCEEENIKRRCNVVEQTRFLLKDDEEARVYMGANGFVEPLVQFLRYAVQERNDKAQDVGAMALFNLAVNNNRNKESIISLGILQLLEDMVLKSTAYESAVALYLNLSCLDVAKAAIGSESIVSVLVRLLQDDIGMQCRLDALHTLYNLSTCPATIPHLLSSGIVAKLQILLSGPLEQSWAGKSISIVSNLAASDIGRKEIVSNPRIISALAGLLDIGELLEQEQAAACLLILCSGDVKCCEMILQEGVIPSLVTLSVNRTSRGKEKAQKLLMLFRAQRQRDTSPVRAVQRMESSHVIGSNHHLSKTRSRKVGRSWSSLWKNKNTVCQHR